MKLLKATFSTSLIAALIGSFGISQSALAFQKQDFIQDAVSVEVTGKGFEVLSRTLEKKFSGESSELKLRDLNLKLPLIAKLGIHDVRVHLDLKKVEVTPYRNGLALKIDINELKIKLGKVDVTSFWIPSRHTSCTGTEITLGNGKPVQIQAKLGVEFKNGEVRFNDEEFRFHVKSDQYTTQGPTACEGNTAFTNRAAKAALKSVIQSARPVINLAAHAAVKILASRVGDSLLMNMANKELQLTLPANPILPQTRLLGAFDVRDLQITPDSLKLRLDLAVARNNRWALSEDEALPEIFKLGTIGLNPALISRLAEVLFDHGKQSIELSAGSLQMLADFFTTTSLGAFLPDLLSVQTDTEQLKLFLSLPQTPMFSFGSEDDLVADLPDAALKLQIQQQGEWKDYFTLHLGTKISIKASINDGKIRILPKLQEFKSWGEWASTYQPQDPTFLHQDFEESIQALVGLISGEGTDGIALDSPKFKLNDGSIELNYIRIEKPYLLLDLNFARQGA